MRRYRRRSGRWLIVLLGIVVAVRVWLDRHRQDPPQTLAAGLYRVARAVDGDTLLLTNGARIRLIGVDSPESVKPGAAIEAWGAEASRFAQNWVDEAAGEVRLAFDRQRLDAYGRFLAYAYSASGMLNEDLLRAGLARAQLHYDYSASMKTRFRRAEDAARENGLGLWSHSPVIRGPTRQPDVAAGASLALPAASP